MKKRLRTTLIVAGAVLVVLVALGAVVWNKASQGMKEVRALVVNPIDLTKIPDGTFQGTFTEGRFTYTVNVAMKDHTVTGIVLSDPKQGSDVTRAIVAKIMAQQVVNVDTVSGATLTTKAFTKAVEIALDKTQHAQGQ